MKVRVLSSNFYQVKKEIYKDLLRASPEVFAMKKKKLMDKERYARYARSLSEQIGCVTRFTISDPDDETWFLNTTAAEHKYYDGKMRALVSAEEEMQEALHEPQEALQEAPEEAVKEHLEPTDEA